MENQPILTVFTPTYNLEPYIEETINSILNQTQTDFEYLIVDDGSSDRTVEIIKSIKDSRIRLIQNSSNKGISYNRNIAIEEAKGKYLAMIDGDDLALPKRFKKQIDFLENNREYGIIGTGVININSLGQELNQEIVYNIPDDQIPSRMLFNNYIATSSVMLRTEIIGSIRFKKDFLVGEDYEVWLQIIRKCKIGHIREPLTKYRIHDNSISIKKKQLMFDTELTLMKQQLKELNCTLSIDEFQAFHDLSKDNQRPYFENFEIINRTISKLYNSNLESKVFENEPFRNLLFSYWHIFFLNIKVYNSSILAESKESGMFQLLSYKEKLKFKLKCNFGK